MNGLDPTTDQPQTLESGLQLHPTAHLKYSPAWLVSKLFRLVREGEGVQNAALDTRMHLDWAGITETSGV